MTDMISTTRRIARQAIACCLPAIGVQSAPGPAQEEVRLVLPVSAVVERHPPYEQFCRRNPVECDLRGPGVTRYSPETARLLSQTNATVNADILFSLDVNQHGVEEYWALPKSGWGDCEDMALEKRSRLVRAGLPRGALRLALVFHRTTQNSHCVLTVETSRGTFVLDSFTDQVERWDRTPYNFEARERTDGRWERYDQSQWGYDW